MPFPQPHLGAPPALMARLEKQQRRAGKPLGAAARVAAPVANISTWGEGHGREYTAGDCVVKLCHGCERMVKMRIDDACTLFCCPFCRFEMWQNLYHEMTTPSVPRESDGDTLIVQHSSRNRYSDAVQMQCSKISRQPSVRTVVGRAPPRSSMSPAFVTTPTITPLDDCASVSSFVTVSCITPFSSALKTPSVRNLGASFPSTPLSVKRSVSFHDTSVPGAGDAPPLISKTPFDIALSTPTKFSAAPKSFFEINRRQMQV